MDVFVTQERVLDSQAYDTNLKVKRERARLMTRRGEFLNGTTFSSEHHIL